MPQNDCIIMRGSVASGRETEVEIDWWFEGAEGPHTSKSHKFKI